MHIPLILLIAFDDGSDDAYCAAHDWFDCCIAFEAEAVEYGAYDGGANIAAGGGNGNDAFPDANAISCISENGRELKSVQTRSSIEKMKKNKKKSNIRETYLWNGCASRELARLAREIELIQ